MDAENKAKIDAVMDWVNSLPDAWLIRDPTGQLATFATTRPQEPSDHFEIVPLYAATEIESLRRENQELREQCAFHTSIIEELSNERDGLRKALEPFAKEADIYDPPRGDDDHPAWSRDFPIGMLRRARRALTMSDIHREQLDRPRREAE